MSKAQTIKSTEALEWHGDAAVRVRYATEGSTYEPVGIYVDGCTYCQGERERGNTFFPSHHASERCQSGKRNHCTCDTCF